MPAFSSRGSLARALGLFPRRTAGELRSSSAEMAQPLAGAPPGLGCSVRADAAPEAEAAEDFAEEDK